MPIYAYKCGSCGHAKDVLQKMSDPPLTVCPACGAEAFSKQLTAAGFQLKGSGWYATDFRGGGSTPPKPSRRRGRRKAADSAPSRPTARAEPRRQPPRPRPAADAPAAPRRRLRQRLRLPLSAAAMLAAAQMAARRPAGHRAAGHHASGCCSGSSARWTACSLAARRRRRCCRSRDRAARALRSVPGLRRAADAGDPAADRRRSQPTSSASGWLRQGDRLLQPHPDRQVDLQLSVKQVSDTLFSEQRQCLSHGGAGAVAARRRRGPSPSSPARPAARWPTHLRRRLPERLRADHAQPDLAASS